MRLSSKGVDGDNCGYGRRSLVVSPKVRAHARHKAARANIDLLLSRVTMAGACEVSTLSSGATC
jgi:hypothetical protein